MVIMWLLSITQVSQVIIVETSKLCTKIVKIFVKYFCWKISVVAALLLGCRRCARYPTPRGISYALLDFFLRSYWDVVAALDILRRGGISYALLDFFLRSLWDVVAALDIPRSQGISHASRAFSLTARRGALAKH